MSQWIDFPVEEESGDELGRGPFAALVAAALLAENRRRATIIGLMGAWGTGKSTLANFIVQRIRATAKDIEVIHFEPWMVSTPEALAHEFFKELGKAILPKGSSKEAQEKRSRFYKYTALTLDALALTSDAGSTVVPLAGLASKALRGSKKAIELAAKGLEAQAHTPTLREARGTLSKALVGLERPVVVVIDDIDRLNTDEVRTVFQLIKACADFPNIRYLLLYDREQVAHALNGSVLDPDAFLEKIIAQTFDLPEATSAQRSAILDQSIAKIFDVDELPKEARERIGSVFNQILLPGLTTLRQVKRYCATVSSLLPGVTDGDGFLNVDPADFLTLEFIRQYTPKLYSVLRDEHQPWVGGLAARYVKHETWQKDMLAKRKEVVESLGAQAEIADYALRQLFPSTSGGPHSFRAKRFDNDYWRPVYFGFCEARAAIREADWRDFLEVAASGDLTKWFDTWEEREARDKWAYAISVRAEELDAKSAERFLTGLFSWSEGREYEQDRFLGAPHISWEEAVRDCGVSVLEGRHKSAEALRIIRAAIKASDSLIGPAIVIGWELGIKAERGSGRWCKKGDVAPIGADLAERIQSMAADGSIWEAPDPCALIDAWHYLDESKKMEFLDTLKLTDEGLAHYLNVMIGRHQHDVNRLDWGGSDQEFLKRIQEFDVSLLSESGLWARDELLRVGLDFMQRNADYMNDE